MKMVHLVHSRFISLNLLVVSFFFLSSGVGGGGEELSEFILTSHNSNSTRSNCNSDIFNYNCD